jgi:hypothetical protein
MVRDAHGNPADGCADGCLGRHASARRTTLSETLGDRRGRHDQSRVRCAANGTTRLTDETQRSSRMQRGRSPVSLADLLTAGLLQPGQELQFRKSAGKRAQIAGDGTIVFEGRAYQSPSTAGRAAAGGASTNGWVSWYVNRAGEWIHLAQLRDELADRQAS